MNRKRNSEQTLGEVKTTGAESGRHMLLMKIRQQQQQQQVAKAGNCSDH